MSIDHAHVPAALKYGLLDQLIQKIAAKRHGGSHAHRHTDDRCYCRACCLSSARVKRLEQKKRHQAKPRHSRLPSWDSLFRKAPDTSDAYSLAQHYL